MGRLSSTTTLIATVVSMTVASDGIVTALAGPTCTILSPSMTMAAWWMGGTW